MHTNQQAPKTGLSDSTPFDSERVNNLKISNCLALMKVASSLKLYTSMSFHFKKKCKMSLLKDFPPKGLMK